MPVEGRGLSSRQTQQAVRDREIGKPNNSETCSKAADGVTPLVTRSAAAALMTSPARRRPAMSRDHDKEAAYEVGYGRAPHHTRFVKGQSGNPKGPPPAAKNVKTLLREALNEPVVI